MDLHMDIILNSLPNTLLNKLYTGQMCATDPRDDNSCARLMLASYNQTVSQEGAGSSQQENLANGMTENKKILQNIAKKLSQLLKEDYCSVCNSSASRHYHQASHYKAVQKWITNEFTKIQKRLDPRLVFCEACNLPLYGKYDASLHYTCSSHQEKMRTFCSICSRIIELRHMETHYKSKKHLKNVSSAKPTDDSFAPLPSAQQSVPGITGSMCNVNGKLIDLRKNVIAGALLEANRTWKLAGTNGFNGRQNSIRAESSNSSSSEEEHYTGFDEKKNTHRRGRKRRNVQLGHGTSDDARSEQTPAYDTINNTDVSSSDEDYLADGDSEENTDEEVYRILKDQSRWKMAELLVMALCYDYCNVCFEWTHQPYNSHFKKNYHLRALATFIKTEGKPLGISMKNIGSIFCLPCHQVFLRTNGAEHYRSRGHQRMAAQFCEVCLVHGGSEEHKNHKKLKDTAKQGSMTKDDKPTIASNSSVNNEDGEAANEPGGEEMISGINADDQGKKLAPIYPRAAADVTGIFTKEPVYIDTCEPSIASLVQTKEPQETTSGITADDQSIKPEPLNPRATTDITGVVFTIATESTETREPSVAETPIDKFFRELDETNKRRAEARERQAMTSGINADDQSKKLAPINPRAAADITGIFTKEPVCIDTCEPSIASAPIASELAETKKKHTQTKEPQETTSGINADDQSIKPESLNPRATTDITGVVFTIATEGTETREPSVAEAPIDKFFRELEEKNKRRAEARERQEMTSGINADDQSKKPKPLNPRATTDTTTISTIATEGIDTREPFIAETAVQKFFRELAQTKPKGIQTKDRQETTSGINESSSAGNQSKKLAPINPGAAADITGIFPKEPVYIETCEPSIRSAPIDKTVRDLAEAKKERTQTKERQETTSGINAHDQSKKSEPLNPRATTDVTGIFSIATEGIETREPSIAGAPIDKIVREVEETKPKRIQTKDRQETISGINEASSADHQSNKSEPLNPKATTDITDILTAPPGGVKTREPSIANASIHKIDPAVPETKKERTQKKITRLRVVEEHRKAQTELERLPLDVRLIYLRKFNEDLFEVRRCIYEIDLITREINDRFACINPETNLASHALCSLIMYMGNFKSLLGKKFSGGEDFEIERAFVWIDIDHVLAPNIWASSKLEQYSSLRLIMQQEKNRLFDYAHQKLNVGTCTIIRRYFSDFRLMISSILRDYCLLDRKLLKPIYEKHPALNPLAHPQFRIPMETNSTTEGADIGFSSENPLAEVRKGIETLNMILLEFFYDSSMKTTFTMAKTLTMFLQNFKQALEQVLDEKGPFSMEGVFELPEKMKLLHSYSDLQATKARKMLFREADALWPMVNCQHAVSCEDIFRYLSHFNWKLLHLLHEARLFNEAKEWYAKKGTDESFEHSELAYLMKRNKLIPLYLGTTESKEGVTFLREAIMYVLNLWEAIDELMVDGNTAPFRHIFELNEEHFPCEPMILNTVKTMSQFEYYKLRLDSAVDSILAYKFHEYWDRFLERYFAKFHCKLLLMIKDLKGASQELWFP